MLNIPVVLTHSMILWALHRSCHFAVSYSLVFRLCFIPTIKNTPLSATPNRPSAPVLLIGGLMTGGQSNHYQMLAPGCLFVRKRTKTPILCSGRGGSCIGKPINKYIHLDIIPYGESLAKRPPYLAPEICTSARQQPHLAEIRRWRRQSVQMGRKICSV